MRLAETGAVGMVPIIITEEDFQYLVTERVRPLPTMVSYLSEHQSVSRVLTHPFLSELLSQSIQMEELLDAYGAQNNSR